MATIATSAPEPMLAVMIRLFERETLKAFADVIFPTLLGELTIKGFTVRQKEGEGPWVGFPSNSYTKDGKKVNSPLFEVTGSFRKHICDAVIAAYKVAKEGR